MKCSTGCCLFCLGGGFVAGAMLASNNAKVRQWFTSTSKKLADMYEDITSKINSGVISCNCSNANKSSEENEQNAGFNNNTKQK